MASQKKKQSEKSGKPQLTENMVKTLDRLLDWGLRILTDAMTMNILLGHSVAMILKGTNCIRFLKS